MWAKIYVYNYETFMGSFYESQDCLQTKSDIIIAINKQFGYGTWTRWTLEY